ncbi:hypothetical protein QBC35DRAFT_494808 [Podospora australis]|uniref:RRM domain-containing protein n=1 Tax=Podospora australis TaxID=1536484 RepID=A0AAN7AJI1_9PEZI|nr:hypothetical protein QBC35DRAFT_494808 [Podospora australis]
MEKIPFATKRSEIIAFLGKNSKILNDNDEPVHIIMERTTSKTGDAYVEFLTKEAAERAVHRHNEATQRGRQPRIGNRPADLAVVNQEHLMQQLFPTAKAVNWSATRATIKEPVEGQPWTIFKGFVSEEELTLLIKHVEQPSRSPYAKDCPQRPYECMISTIRKYPWYMSEHITIKQRQMVFNTTLRLTEILRRVIDRGVTRGDERGRVNRAGEVVLNEQLFKRLVYTALACTGFSAYQKNEIARVAGWSNEKVVHGFNQPPNAGAWVHLHTSAPRPGMPLDLLGWYIAVIRERTTDMVRRLPNQERMEMEQLGTKTDMTFGYLFWVMKIPKVEQLELMTLKQVYNMEYNAIKTVLEGAAADAHANRLRYALPTAETDEDSET